jgi:hypothetical protein
MMTPAAHKFKRFAIVECWRAGGGVPVYLEGGPCDGIEEKIPLSASGVMAVCTWPEADDGGPTDHFYVKTTTWRKHRLVCRYSGRRRRG